METQGYASIFISYSHQDRPWMEVFRKELKAALYGKATVWCDQDIDGGSDWQGRLALELHRADVALILATSDYLISPWCRRELQYIDQMFQKKQIKYVFWVPLKPCAWERTELAKFQRKEPLSNNALSEIRDEIARERAIIDVVREICSGVEDIGKSLDPNLTFVQSIVGDQAFEKGLSIDSLLSNDGDFAIVCRGRNSSQQNVTIKVLRRSPVNGILDKLEKTAEHRKELRDPGFIQLYDSFRTSQPAEHLVLVMEYCRGKSLSQALQDPELKARFTMDYVVFLLRRTAETLRELHKLESARNKKSPDIDDLGYGPMMPAHVFYDDRLERLRFSPMSISNFSWNVLGWRKFAAWINPDSARYVAPEQIKGPSSEAKGAKIDKLKLDQYMLGQLAVEMLDGPIPVKQDGPDDIAQKKAEFFDNPLKNAGHWKDRHPQLARIIATMLSRNPDDRWNDMGEVVTQLQAVEDEGRALAKSAYMRWIDKDETFFQDFYRSFFESKIAQDSKTLSKFKNHGQQHEYLKKAMAAVLNFNPGNEPTSLRYVVNAHKDKGVTEAELNQFECNFITLLKERLERIDVSQMAIDEKDHICEAWKHLFDQVLQYFRQEGLKE
jgi:serine/threonine protein kinase